MNATTARPLLRWSSARDCGRKAVYEATGAPMRERTNREERILFRGKRIGRDYAELLSLKHNSRDLHRKFIRARVRSEEQGGGYYGAGKVWCEKKVVWPLGIGHMDIWLPLTGTGVEILSSAHASEENVRSKLLQLVGYLEHDPEAENGALVILNPADYDEERILVSPRSSTYAELVEEMRERIRQVQSWDETGEPPPRVCGKPSDARSHFCPFAEHCFDGWRPPARSLVDDADAVELVTRWQALKGAGRETEAQKQAEKERKQVEAQLAELVPVGEAQVGPFKVVRTHISRKPSFQWERAELAGVFDPEPLGDFFKPGAVYDTYAVERLTPEFLDEALAPAQDWGDVPWTSEDLEGEDGLGG